ncbi:structural protein [Pseudomonas phage vB_PaeM_USP_25]|nr:structural protein [Pseudomonas phage vB_PaeM_USP_25]
MRQFGNVPYGNVTTLAFALATLASGAAANSDSTEALGIGDVVDLGPLPEGMRLDDASVIVTTGMTATITGSLGFKYEDGVDSTEVPQDAAYFGSGIDLAATGRKRATGSKLVTLPKPARLILTTAVAANAKASDIKVLVTGEQIGNR